MKLNTLTLQAAIEGLKNKKFSSQELVSACLRQIEKDKELNTFITVFNEESLELSKKYDKEIMSNSSIFNTKPLLGIPIALKDNYVTKDLRTTAASLVLDDYIPQYDATLVTRLKNAGAIIIGKTNMDAWAHGSSTETSAYGSSKNPHDPTRIPGGSSGGSAAAVAADEVILSMGSETAGSTRQPAAWCGVVGLKPTYGRVSRYGIIAMGSSLDSPGPLTKTVWDSALILSITAGKDPEDATTSEEPIDKYHEKLTTSIKGLKIGIPKEYFMDDAEEGINEMIQDQIEIMKSLGAEIIEVSMIDPKYSIADYTVIQRSEVFSNLARYDGIRYGNDRTNFGQEAKRRQILGAYALKIGKDGLYYKLAQKVRTLLKNDFDETFKKVDVLLAPTVPSVAPKLGASKDQAMFGELVDLLQEPSSMTGMTGISIPCGTLRGMPVGMQFIGNHYQEQKILNAAHAYEINTDWRKNAK